MSVKIDKYELLVRMNYCQIFDKSYFEDKPIITFNIANGKANKKLAEMCLKELNSGKYEEKIIDG